MYNRLWISTCHTCLTWHLFGTWRLLHQYTLYSNPRDWMRPGVYTRLATVWFMRSCCFLVRCLLYVFNSQGKIWFPPWICSNYTYPPPKYFEQCLFLFLPTLPFMLLLTHTCIHACTCAILWLGTVSLSRVWLCWHKVDILIITMEIVVPLNGRWRHMVLWLVPAMSPWSSTYLTGCSWMGGRTVQRNINTLITTIVGMCLMNLLELLIALGWGCYFPWVCRVCHVPCVLKILW